MLCLHPAGGNKVDLSAATVTFTKGVLGFLADGLSVNTPQVNHESCLIFFNESFHKSHQFTFDFFANNGIKLCNVVAHICSES